MARWGTFLIILTVVTIVKLSYGMGLCEFAAKFPGSESSESCYKSNANSVPTKQETNGTSEKRSTTNIDQRTSEEIATTDHQPATGRFSNVGEVYSNCTCLGSCSASDGISCCLDGTSIGPGGCACENEILWGDESTNLTVEGCQCFWPRVNLSISEENQEGITIWPRDCTDINTKCGPSASSGIYLIKPTGASEPFPVYCNNSIDGGGWTVFQRRVDGSVDFYRTWNDYRHGFGFLHGEFWLGNNKTHLLTQQKDYELRIDMNDKYGNPYYAHYTLFRIGGKVTNYKLTELGSFSGTAKNDRLRNSVRFAFSTWDQANDPLTTNQAELCHGAWWYSHNSCDRVDGNIANLNGLFDASGQHEYTSIYWDDLNGDNDIQTNLKYSEMKIRSDM